MTAMSKWEQIPAVIRLGILFLAMVAVVAVALFWYVPAWDESEPPPLPKENYQGSFKWSQPIYHLYQAAIRPPTEAVTLLLQTSLHLRSYVAIEILSTATPGDPLREAKLGDPILEKAITLKIDEMILKRIVTKGSMTSVSCVLSRQPFPFTVIHALKSHGVPWASLVFDLPEGSLVSPRTIEAECGALLERKPDPFDSDNFLMTFRTETKSYTATTVLKLKTSTEQAKSVMITVQRRAKK
jgi:hypothetical protein